MMRSIEVHIFLLAATHALSFFFFFNDTATTEIYTLSLHDALPISEISPQLRQQVREMITDEAGRDKVFIGEVMKDRKSTRLNSSHTVISYAVFCLKKKKKTPIVDNRPDTNNRAPHDLVVSDSPDAL